MSRGVYFITSVCRDESSKDLLKSELEGTWTKVLLHCLREK